MNLPAYNDSKGVAIRNCSRYRMVSVSKAYKREMGMNRMKTMRGIAVLLAAIPLFYLFSNILQTIFVSGANVSEESEHCSDQKLIALTFDDGPNALYTPLLLDGLKERNVKATFFLIGKSAEEQPELVQRMYEEGHLIGNHTYNHVNLRNMTESAACEQVRKTNEVIKSTTGYDPEYVRPPFGEWRKSIDKDMTMIKVMWDIDPLDWATGNSKAVVERVVKKCSDNDIILMHDASASSVKAALEIIDILQEEGYQFVTVDRLILD